MSERHLDGSQVGSRLQVMGCKTVPQCMARNSFFDPRCSPDINTLFLEHRWVKLLMRRRRSRKKVLRRLVMLPVIPQHTKKRFCQRGQAVFLSFTRTNAKDHSFTVNIIYTKIQYFGESQAGCVHDHQCSVKLLVFHMLEKMSTFRFAQDRKSTRLNSSHYS